MLIEKLTEGKRAAMLLLSAVRLEKALATALESALPSATTLVVEVSAVFITLVKFAPIDVSTGPTCSASELLALGLVPTLYSRDTTRSADADS